MKYCPSSLALIALSVYFGAITTTSATETPPELPRAASSGLQPNAAETSSTEALEKAPLLEEAPGAASTESHQEAPEAAASMELQEDVIASEAEENESWIDTTHSAVSNSADNLANWIDHFFGSDRDDIESAYSSLRLTWENDWEEGEGQETDIKLRGKVHLPRIDERLSLIFTDEEGEITDETEQLNEMEGRPETTRVALQYKAKEDKRYRIDYRLGVRSSLKARASVRYRYQLPVGDDSTHRFTETLYFIDGEGFGSRSRYEFDYLLRESHLFRWTNTARFEEEGNGVEWTSRLTLGKRQNDKSALSYFTWISGDTRPVHITTSFGFGVKYRRNFHRPWLFFELEPAYAWARELPEEDREGIYLFSARLEILLEKLERLENHD